MDPALLKQAISVIDGTEVVGGEFGNSIIENGDELTKGWKPTLPDFEMALPEEEE